MHNQLVSVFMSLILGLENFTENTLPTINQLIPYQLYRSNLIPKLLVW